MCYPINLATFSAPVIQKNIFEMVQLAKSHIQNSIFWHMFFIVPNQNFKNDQKS